MKSGFQLFLLFSTLVIFTLPLKATNTACAKTKQDLFNAVKDAVKYCDTQTVPLTKKSNLWNWKWHHGSCLVKPKKCSTLASLEDEFTKTLNEGFIYIGDKKKEMESKIAAQKDEMSSAFCSAISQDAQALVVGCKSIGVNLGDNLKKIEQLHKEVFGN